MAKTKSTFGFAYTQVNEKKQKSCFLANARKKTVTESNE